MIEGFGLVLLAGIFQGSFVLPMTCTRKWRWEHVWLTFTVLGMFVFNWGMATATLPGLAGIAARIRPADAGVLVLFGAGWGAGALLFGISMDRLGMSLGYPIIMGTIACLGALIPMAIFHPAMLTAPKGLLTLGGTAVAVAGIVLCSRAGAQRQPARAAASARSTTGLSRGLAMALLAGALSCLPNVGMAFGAPVIQAAVRAGASAAIAPNAVWLVFFTAGGIVNCVYCVRQIVAHHAGAEFGASEWRRNTGLVAIMGALWIGSFYLYGAASQRLGPWGAIAGWPVFISLSIGTGVLWGLSRGEWAGAPLEARRLRNSGLLVLLAGVVLISSSNLT